MGGNCNSTELVCENNCHGNGACILGSCACNTGWSGRSCAVPATELMKGKTQQVHLTDQQATESAVTNPDSENLVHVHEASVDYSIPSGKTATTDQIERPNQISLSKDILPKEVVEPTKPTTNKANIIKAAQKAKGGATATAPTSMLLQIEETVSSRISLPSVVECSPPDCSSRGKCHRGTCFCSPGYGGDGCEQLLECPGANCHGHGDCANGKCVCEPGFQGDACEIKDKCLEECNQRGVCRWGKCFCDVGFDGDACENQASAKECPAGCSGNGVCEAGVCFCKSSHTGADCSKTVDLHRASVLWANVQKSENQHTKGASYVDGTSALGVASLCFFFGIGAATLATRYQ